MNCRLSPKWSLLLKVGSSFFLCLLLCVFPVYGQYRNALESKLDQVIVPKVDFKDVSLDSALDFMTQIPVKTKQMETAVNIVKAYKTVDPSLNDVHITLTLTNVPWTELMRYVCMSANVRVNYEAYAVVVGAPLPPATPTPSSGR